MNHFSPGPTRDAQETCSKREETSKRHVVFVGVLARHVVFVGVLVRLPSLSFPPSSLSPSFQPSCPIALPCSARLPHTRLVLVSRSLFLSLALLSSLSSLLHAPRALLSATIPPSLSLPRRRLSLALSAIPPSLSPSLRPQPGSAAPLLGGHAGSKQQRGAAWGRQRAATRCCVGPPPAGV